MLMQVQLVLQQKRIGIDTGYGGKCYKCTVVWKCGGRAHVLL